jgi:RNA polymerase subunit RPABC4/transcription elongation factor Spt4
MERGLELDRTRLGNLQEIKVLEARGDQELQEIYLAAEINRDQLLEGQSVNTAKVDVQIRTIELDVQRQEANLKLETQQQQENLRLDVERQEAQARIDELEAQSRLEMGEMEQLVNLQSRRKAEKHLQGLELRRIEIDNDFRRQKQEQESQFANRQQDLEAARDQLGMVERLVLKGLDVGAEESGVLKDMIEATTEQRMSDAQVQARADARAARHSVEAMHEEQDRERTHQAEMTGLGSEMMEAAKQTPGVPTPDQPVASSPPQQGPTINVTSVSSTPQAPAAGASCLSCSAAIQPGWKACPQCGTPISQGPQCPSCQNTVEAGWKACPNCGSSLISDLDCPNCKSTVEASWKACPSCGTSLSSPRQCPLK